MRKIFFLAGGIICLLGFFGYTQDTKLVYRDPFASLLPKNDTAATPTDFAESSITPPALNIQGLLWGANMPMAIIDGEVYKEGDTLDNVGVKIYKIEKNKIYIIYRGKTFDVPMEK